MERFYLALTTLKNREALRLAEHLVSEKLATCANMVHRVESTCRWKGKIERARETMMLIKTSEKKVDRLIHRIKELHPYELPEILALRIDRGLGEYLEWVDKSLR
ncbi:MAG: divalent-cation tolerance protein CutA [Hadesarchaea archaeon]|nr:MAG: divalent-cation tolerance protein CutA [Hadesarchaea archaeon]